MLARAILRRTSISPEIPRELLRSTFLDDSPYSDRREINWKLDYKPGGRLFLAKIRRGEINRLCLRHRRV